MHLIFPNAENIVWVTSIDGLDETRVSANHLEGTPVTIIVSGCLLLPLAYPKQIHVSSSSRQYHLRKNTERKMEKEEEKEAYKDKSPYQDTYQ